MLDAIETAIAALLVIEGKPAGTYRFSHALHTRRCVRIAQRQPAGCSCIGRIGGVLEGSSRRQARVAERSPRLSLFEAIPLSGEVDKAIQYCAVQAGRRADRLLAI